MAFRFNWQTFDPQFCQVARIQLEAALNKGNKPKNIVDYISVKELNMGTIAPELEVLEIGELTTDSFRGMFKLTYNGNAYIVIQTKIQANSLHTKQQFKASHHTRPNILAADQPLIVPMLLKISHLKLRGIIFLVVSKTKGVTLVFKNDPLESVFVSSTFDSVASVRGFLQLEIEKQLRNLFQEGLPIMIHNLSQRYIINDVGPHLTNSATTTMKANTLERNKFNSRRSVFPSTGCTSAAQQKQCQQATFSLSDLYPQHQFGAFSAITAVRASMFYPPCLYSVHQHYRYQFYNSGALIYSQLHPPSTIHTCPLSTKDEQDVEDLNHIQPPDSVPDSFRFFPSSLDIIERENENSVNATATKCHSHLMPVETSSVLPTTTSSSIEQLNEIYANDANAPWYVKELPPPFLDRILSDDCNKAFIPMEEDILIHLEENTLAAKLAKIVTVHYTLSPFSSHLFEHFTFRSVPHSISTVLLASKKKHNKRIPKRRIIRWSSS